MNQKICCVVAALALAACGQVEPLDGNRIVSLADAGPAPVRDAGAPTDAGVAKPDTGASDAGPRNDDHSDARVGGSRLAPGQGIAGVLDGDDDADWFVFTAGAGDLHRVETRGETDTKCALFDAQGEAVADDDDGGDGLNCRMEEALRAGADYFVKVEHFSGSGTGSYTLFVEIVAAQSVEPELRAQPSSAAAGEVFGLTGTGFSAEGRVRFEVAAAGGSNEEFEAVADDQGAFETDWQTTRQTVPGRYRIVATDQETGRSAQAVEVTVTAPPQDDHADEAGAATVIRSGRFTPGEIHTATDVDWFRFRTTHAGDWVINTRGQLDTVCALEFAGQEVASDDDSGEGLNCRIDAALQPDRDYFVRVESYGERIGDYEFVVVPPPVPDDHGDTEATATVLDADRSDSGRLGAAGDVDLFGFTARFTGVYRFWTIGVTDTACRLIELGGRTRVTDDNSGLLWNCELEQRLEAGTTYYVEVRHSDAEGTGAYWLFSSLPEGQPADDHGNTLDGATLVADRGSSPGRIDAAGDRDMFHFYAQQDGQWTIETSSDLDTVCEVVSADGAQLASNDDAGEDRNCRMTVSLSAGRRYGVSVRLFGGGGEGAYRLRLSPP